MYICSISNFACSHFQCEHIQFESKLPCECISLMLALWKSTHRHTKTHLSKIVPLFPLAVVRMNASIYCFTLTIDDIAKTNHQTIGNDNGYRVFNTQGHNQIKGHKRRFFIMYPHTIHTSIFALHWHNQHISGSIQKPMIQKTKYRNGENKRRKKIKQTLDMATCVCICASRGSAIMCQ